MQHRGTETLETKRLILRRFAITDAEAAFRNWMSDKEVTKFLTWPAHTDISFTKMVLRDWSNRYNDKKYYQWAIVLKDSDEPIGSISVVNDIDDSLQKAVIGYCIGKKWWHTGITSEALARIIAFLFDEVGVNKLESMHDSRNPNSGKVMAKCGMKFEGTLRQSDLNNQGICDACYYGLLRNER